MSRSPSVSIAIPALNESAHIERVVSTFLSTSYPNLIEVFVADGGSTDGTQGIVEALAERDPRVRLIHNPGRVQSAGLNLMLEQATGEVFLRADAHCDYAGDYIESCIETLLENGATNVGGAQRFVANTTFQGGVALASTSIMGTGGAKYRDPEYDGHVEAVYLGCFWRRALLDISGYSRMATCEDAELNLRLLKRAAQRTTHGLPPILYTSPRIRVWYHPRSNWSSLFRQYFNYGRGRCQTVRAHPNIAPIRGKLPFLFLFFVSLILAADLFLFSGSLHMKALVLIGLSFPFIEGFRVSFKHRKRFEEEFWQGPKDRRPTLVSRSLACGLVLLTQPIAHFLGFGYELLVGTIGRLGLAQQVQTAEAPGDPPPSHE